MKMRLDRYLADLGIATRSELKTMIRAGRVSVDGAAVKAPEFRLDPDLSSVCLDGRPLSYSRFRYFMIDKPTGVLTACEDRKQRTVIDLLPDELKRLDLFPVGRLDKDTSGLLLLTNDGDFAHRVISPKYEVEKLYRAVTEVPVGEEAVSAFAKGIRLADGLQCLPAKLEAGEGNVCFVTVKEGKYHQVRRMLAASGCRVLELRRLSIGALQLDEDTYPGKISELSQTKTELIFE